METTFGCNYNCLEAMTKDGKNLKCTLNVKVLSTAEAAYTTKKTDHSLHPRDEVRNLYLDSIDLINIMRFSNLII